MNEWNEKQKAAHAKALLEDPMLEQFFTDAARQVFEAWAVTLDRVERDRLWERQQALTELRAYLHGYIAAGTLLTHAEQTE
jgi:hypothetical protein